MLKAAIFDMDGVLIDSHPIHKRAWARFLESIGRTVSESDLNFVLDGRKKEDILRHFLGDLPDDQTHEFGTRKEQLFREEALEIPATEGLFDFLEQLKAAEVTMALASSGSKSRVHFILERLAIADYFSAVITGDDVRHGKPSPDIFLRAASALGVSPSEAVVFEDAVAGVEAAKKAGMKCLAVASNGRAEALKRAGADRIIADFTELNLSTLAALS